MKTSKKPHQNCFAILNPIKGQIRDIMRPDTISIKKMDIEEVDQVVSIAATSPLNRWSKDMFLGEMAHPFSHCFLLFGRNGREKGSPVGFICFRNIEEESELLNLCIHPQHRQKGLARRLMAFYIDFCSQRGVKKFYLEVDPLNIAAVNLYQSFAFQPVGKRKKFYKGANDAMIMSR